MDNRFVDVVLIEMLEPHPLRVGDLIKGTDVPTRCLKTKTKIEMQMLRLGFPRRNLMHVHSDRVVCESPKIGNAGLLKYLATRSRLGARIVRIDMATRLQPAAKLPMQDEKQ